MLKHVNIGFYDFDLEDKKKRSGQLKKFEDAELHCRMKIHLERLKN